MNFDENKYLGKKYNNLTILNFTVNIPMKKIAHCKCDCGNYKDIELYNILKGTTKSCGCLQKEHITNLRKSHNLSKTRIYKIFKGMCDRCYNKNRHEYKYYGGKGICICKEWLDDFLNFYNWSMENGYKENLTIDRINPDEMYSPKNCRWVSMREQSTNKNIYSSNTSGYNGIYKHYDKWMSCIQVDGNVFHLGRYKTKKEALDKRNQFIRDNNLIGYKIQEYKGEK